MSLQYIIYNRLADSFLNLETIFKYSNKLISNDSPGADGDKYVES